MKSHPLFEKLRIFAPGPTPVPEAVLGTLARAPLHHRTQEFEQVLGRVREGLGMLFQTKQPCYVLASSGTGAMEATVANCFATGDEVLVINGGKFGERWGKIAEAFSLKTHWLNVEWGRSADPAAVAKALKANPAIRGVLFQASETSTGTAHPVKEISAAVHQSSDALVVVDAITALGVYDLPMDDWGLDVVLSGSQKALMLPPGLAFLSLSSRANDARKRAHQPAFYFNLAHEDKALGSAQTAWTPAVSLICGLDVVLTRFREVGLKPVFDYHAKLAEATRRGAKGMGLDLLCRDLPSAAVTAILLPSGFSEGKKLLSHLRDEYGITVAEGQDQYKGKMFRIAHLGYYDELDMLTVLSAVEMTLSTLGLPLELGRGVGAAARSFLEGNK